MLEASSRGRYILLTALERIGCDQCENYVESGGKYIQVPQFGYRPLNFCIHCVEMSQE
jgi:hypothetical protein